MELTRHYLTIVYFCAIMMLVMKQPTNPADNGDAPHSLEQPNSGIQNILTQTSDSTSVTEGQVVTELPVSELPNLGIDAILASTCDTDLHKQKKIRELGQRAVMFTMGTIAWSGVTLTAGNRYVAAGSTIATGLSSFKAIQAQRQKDRLK